MFDSIGNYLEQMIPKINQYPVTLPFNIVGVAFPSLKGQM